MVFEMLGIAVHLYDLDGKNGMKRALSVSFGFILMLVLFTSIPALAQTGERVSMSVPLGADIMHLMSGVSKGGI